MVTPDRAVADGAGEVFHDLTNDRCHVLRRRLFWGHDAKSLVGELAGCKVDGRPLMPLPPMSMPSTGALCELLVARSCWRSSSDIRPLRECLGPAISLRLESNEHLVDIRPCIEFQQRCQQLQELLLFWCDRSGRTDRDAERSQCQSAAAPSESRSIPLAQVGRGLPGFGAIRRRQVGRRASKSSSRPERSAAIEVRTSRAGSGARNATATTVSQKAASS